jgi:Mitochondrial K+-H+ exchange-related
MVAYLVPVGRARFELYSEAHVHSDEAPAAESGFIRRWMHTAGVRWNEMVDGARRGEGKGRFARWRDRIVHRLAESIAEQRTLWALRCADAATVRFPATSTEAQARAALEAILVHARRHHGRWLLVDLLITSITGPLFFFVPGPNIVSWYFAFRTVGHWQSWRGARQAMTLTAWTYEPSQGLAELGTLLNVPRASRASRVAEIAAGLHLSRLSAFFERVAV